MDGHIFVSGLGLRRSQEVESCVSYVDDIFADGGVWVMTAPLIEAFYGVVGRGLECHT